MAEHRIEIHQGDTSRRVEVTGVVEVGRQDCDLTLDDPAMSRRHLSLDASGELLIVEDLGSSNGTLLNGTPISGPVVLGPEDEIRAGDTTFRLLTAEDQDPKTTIGPSETAAAVDAPTPAPPDSPPTSLQPQQTVEPRPLPHEFESLSRDGIEIRFRPDTAGADAAKPMAAAALKARKALGGFGSEPWGTPVVIYLTDPFPAPEDSGRVVASGSIVDATAGEIWMVTTPDSPPEDPHRPLALLFGASLPSSEEIDHLIEGYGLHLAGVPSTRPQLDGLELTPFAEAEGELRSAMAVEYVRALLDREDDETFRRLLAAPAGRVEQTFHELYGQSSTALEQAWMLDMMSGEPEVKTGEFLRLSVRYLRPYKLRQLEIFAYMLLSLAFTAAFPFVSRELFDSAIPSGEFSEVFTLLVLLGIAFTVSLVAGLRQAYQSAWVSGAVVRDLRQEMFDRLQRLPASWFHRYDQGDVLSRLFSDVGAVQSGLSDTIGQGFYQALTLVVSSVIMLTISLPLGIVVLIGAPLVALVYKTMAGGAQTRSLAVREENSALMNVAAENYGASPVVKMFGLHHRESDRFGRASDRSFRAQRRMSLFGGIFGLSVNMIVTLLRLGVLGFGAWLILEGEFTLGGLVAFLAIMGEVISPVTVLTTLGQNIQSAMGALIRINEVLDAEEEPADDFDVKLPRMERELRLAGVGFSYTPARRVLDGIDATIPAGSKVAFVGPSGSGKSTVLRLLMRMHEPEEGSIQVDGIDVRTATMSSLRDQMGVVFQDSFLFNTTIRENIALGKPGAGDAEVEAAAMAAEIDQFVDTLPRGYDTLVGERGGNLSGGQRQRVAIARALIRDPRILLLDEATSALDPATERQINETLARLDGSRTVVSITHRLTSLTDYDRIFVIAEGRLVESGSHDDLVSQRGVYARLWAEQTGAPIPEEAPFDAAAALRKVVLFRDLEPTALEEVAARLRSFTLDPGENLAEQPGHLVLVARGRGELLSPSLGGEMVATGELTGGDTFGVPALMGEATGISVRAIGPMTLLELDPQAIDATAARHPEVRAALDTVPAGGAPASGKRLGRATFAIRIDDITSTRSIDKAAKGPDEADIRRATGTFPRMDV